MALADDLASFNSELGGEVGLEQDWRQEGRLQGEAGRGQGLHDSKGGHNQHTGCCSRCGELNPTSGSEHAGCRSSSSSPNTDGRALSVGGSGQGWPKR
jgi:hypothetical protein